MKIHNSTLADFEMILELYAAAREKQKEQKMVIWPIFDHDLIQREIRENRQWKLMDDSENVLCVWATTFEDKQIWEEKDKNDAVYIHRIATHPNFRGFRNVDRITDWAKNYAINNGKRYVRLDTLGNNTKLIEHYTRSGFAYLGVVHLKNTSDLPLHYQREKDCLLFEIDVEK